MCLECIIFKKLRVKLVVENLITVNILLIVKNVLFMEILF